MPARKRKSSLRWVSEGLQVEVSDRYGHWYPCEVTEVWFDEGYDGIKVSYHAWAKRYDEWVAPTPRG